MCAVGCLSTNADAGRPVTARLTRRPGGPARLRALLESGQTIVAPGAFDPLSARLVEQAGFPAVYMTGFGTSAALIGRPDVGLLTMTEMAGNAGRIADCVDVPVIADADTGYGNPLNVIRTVGAYEAAGVAGIHIEDQVGAKRCGHRPGKELVTKEEMVDRIKAAVDARTDSGFFIMARTDAIASEGVERAIERVVQSAPPGAHTPISVAVTVTAVPPDSRSALSTMKSPSAFGTRIPAANVRGSGHGSDSFRPSTNALTIGAQPAACTTTKRAAGTSWTWPQRGDCSPGPRPRAVVSPFAAKPTAVPSSGNLRRISMPAKPASRGRTSKVSMPLLSVGVS